MSNINRRKTHSDCVIHYCHISRSNVYKIVFLDLVKIIEGFVLFNFKPPTQTVGYIKDDANILYKS